MISQSSTNADGSHTYFCYRDGKYLDCPNDLEEAKTVCEKGKMRPERALSRDRVRAFVRDTPGDIEAFKKLDEHERGALREIYPHLCPRKSTLDLDRSKAGPQTRARIELAAGAARRVEGLPEGKIVRIKEGNPKQAGTDAHARWEILFKSAGATVMEYVAAKGNPTTLKNAIKAGYVRVES